EFYKQPFADSIQHYVTTGTYEYEDWSNILNETYRDFMQDSVIDNFKNNPNHSVNVAARKSDIIDWAPQQPVKMLYCASDIVVFPQNSIVAEKKMKALGAKDVEAIDLNPEGDHNSCYNPAMVYALDWFNELREDCGE
ncbi:MAG: hypothetical protein HRT72_08995, partial [Flavobacteriales bacterium]|nr:hypothetical protein [Flavobacteriales bacterium]